MSRGLGKFERWILIHTYLKTVEGQLPGKWQQFENESIPSYLYKSEILLNYFQLERSKLLIYKGGRSEQLKYPQGFKTNNAYKTALASYCRVCRSLVVKGYIDTWAKSYYDDKNFSCNDFGGGEWITLTKAGKEKTEQLVSANTT